MLIVKAIPWARPCPPEGVARKAKNNASADTHQGYSRKVHGLHVPSTERDQGVPYKNLRSVAISHGQAA